MIKQKLEKINKRIAEIRKMSCRLFIIHYFVNDNKYQYEGILYNSLEQLKKEYGITDNDEVMIMPIEFV